MCEFIEVMYIYSLIHIFIYGCIFLAINGVISIFYHSQVDVIKLAKEIAHNILIYVPECKGIHLYTGIACILLGKIIW
jgi:hypothetical protein